MENYAFLKDNLFGVKKSGVLKISGKQESRNFTVQSCLGLI